MIARTGVEIIYSPHAVEGFKKGAEDRKAGVAADIGMPVWLAGPSADANARHVFGNPAAQRGGKFGLEDSDELCHRDLLPFAYTCLRIHREPFQNE